MNEELEPKIVRLYANSNSLAEVISISPIRLENEIGQFLDEKWTPQQHVREVALFHFETVAQRPADEITALTHREIIPP
jgi:HD-like signal output (HDOD) protein